MTKQYYFMFSNGSYSDYYVGGMYVCDHEVTETEWYEFRRQSKSDEKAHKERTIVAYGERTGKGHTKTIYHQRDGNDLVVVNADGYFLSPEYKEYRKWCEENDPNEAFRKLHGMVEIEYVECWDA
jgi:hypothetical protein